MKIEGGIKVDGYMSCLGDQVVLRHRAGAYFWRENGFSFGH